MSLGKACTLHARPTGCARQRKRRKAGAQAVGYARECECSAGGGRCEVSCQLAWRVGAGRWPCLATTAEEMQKTGATTWCGVAAGGGGRAPNTRRDRGDRCLPASPHPRWRPRATPSTCWAAVGTAGASPPRASRRRRARRRRGRRGPRPMAGTPRSRSRRPPRPPSPPRPSPSCSAPGTPPRPWRRRQWPRRPASWAPWPRTGPTRCGGGGAAGSA